MQKDCSDKPRFPPQLKKLSKYHVRLLTKRTVIKPADIWPLGGGSSCSSCQSHSGNEMPLSVIALWLSLLMWNPFSLFEYTLSGKKRSKLKSSLPSFWQGASDSKWLPGLFTAERHPSVLDCLLSFTMASFSLYWFALTANPACPN